MSEPMATSDALGGADGTQLPEPLPVLADPLIGLERGTQWDVPELPPLVLLPIPDASVAALGDDPTDDPTGPVDQHPAEVPDPQPAPQATGQPDAPNASAPNAAVPNAAVGVPPHSAASVGRPAGTPTEGPSATGAGDRATPRRPLRSRPPMAAVSRKLVSPADLGRRIRRERVGSSPQIRSTGGVAALLLFMLIIICLLVYNIVTGFWEWISSFLQ